MIESNKNLYIASDHAGFAYKEKLIGELINLGYNVKDFGPSSAESVDFPDYAHPLAKAVADDKDSKGILICGTGNGMCMAANKHKNIRAALCWSTEIAALAREHNNANIVCMPARFVSYEEAWNIIKVFLQTEFSEGRHINRINKIDL